MKRYFTTATHPLESGFHCQSAFHFIDLPGGGHVVCMMESEHTPDPSWTELPHLLDQSSARFDGVQHALGASPAIPAGQAAPKPLGGIVATDNTFQVAKKLATVHPLFHP